MDKIICIGKNYLEHARELGDAVPDKPVIFLKPPSTLKQASAWGSSVQAVFPEGESDVHPECEIVFRIAKDGYRLALQEADDFIDGITIGLDMTLRSRQAQLKKAGHPWTTSKVFLDAAIIGPWIQPYADFMQTKFSLSLDNHITQKAIGAEMMMKPVELLVYVSHFFPLCKGDLVFTGTPVGVKAISSETKAVLRWDDKAFFVEWGKANPP